MDGSITQTIREVDRLIMMKIFPQHRSVLNQLMRDNANNKGIFSNGTTYDQEYSHGSGSSDTSTAQTLRSTFAAYLGFRNMRKADGSTLGPREAFDRLGIHFGDDGLDAGLPSPNHAWACRKVGLVLETHIISRWDRGVNFLARYYSPDVWGGRLDSMCDIKRQLSKFHTTVRLPEGVPLQDKLVEKARGFVSTDGETPVIGPFCKRALELCLPPKRALDIQSWWAKFEASDQFPNSNVDGWMDAEFEAQFPEFDRSIFNDFLETTRSARDLLQAPLCADIKPPNPTTVEVVVDDDVQYPAINGSIIGAKESKDAITKSPRTSTKEDREKKRASNEKQRRAVYKHVTLKT